MPNHQYSTTPPYAPTTYTTGEATMKTPAVTSTLDTEAIQTLFHQITQALTVLSSAAELTGVRGQENSSQASIRVWLQPSARRAEDALRKVRELNLPHSQAFMDLTQSLTVLVLAADMITQGHMNSDMAQESYLLMRRNSERAMASMRELRILLNV